MTPVGYLHRDYAASLSHLGVPRKLHESGAWVLEREIPGAGARDAMGCYPLFACQDWHHLREDLEALSQDLVSVTLVMDPFAAEEHASAWRTTFDTVRPFKTHFVTRLRGPWQTAVSAHHRYYANKAAASVRVARVATPATCATEWIELYQRLMARRALRGVHALPPSALAAHLTVPGIALFIARCGEQVVGAHLWYVNGPVAYSHLAAASAEGLRYGASYALHAAALESFSGEIEWADLGGAAGTKDHASDGLAWFKRGWATETRTAFLCGRVFDQERYQQLASVSGIADPDYFPVYRAGEFE